MGEAFTGTDRFKIIRRLGKGGTGIVYLAHDTHRGLDVALKMLQQDSPYGILRLKNEFRSLAEVSHTNLVDLHDLHQDANTWFFTMEYVDGVDFLDWVRPVSEQTGERELDLLRLRSAMEQLASGVATLHASGHLHRDIKPSNLLVDKSGRVVILDFGLATHMNQIDIRDIRGFSGTLEYMAPEQSDGSDPVAASDWYSVGVVLFEALTGQLPFQGKALQVALQKKQNNGPAPRTIHPRVPPDLDALCESLLRCKADERADEDQILQALGVELEESMIMQGSTTSLSSMPRLIGRESHLGTLVAAMGAVRKGKSVLCSVHGRSGMGKSALVRYFLEPLRRRSDVLVLKGRCYERESVPYKAFDRVFDDLTRQLNQMPRALIQQLIPNGIAALTQLFPVLLNVPAISQAVDEEGQSLDFSETRQMAFEAARQLFRSLANRWLLAIHIDDVHWGDEDSIALMAEIFQRPDAPQFMMLCSFHTEAIHGSAFVRFLRFMVARSSHDFLGREIEIGPLDDRQARSLARFLLRDVTQMDRHLDKIVSEAGGNPFFIESLSRHLTEFQENRGRGNAFETGAMTIDSLVGSRLAIVDPSALRLLQVVAVSNKPLLRSLAVEVTALGAQSERDISQLRAAYLLRVKTIDGEDYLEMYHDRLRSTVLGTMTDKVMTQLNLEIALCLERVGQDQPESLVDHFVQAGELDRARQYTAESASRAKSKMAFDHAAGLYNQALDIHRQSVTIPASPQALDEEVELLMALGEALENSSRARQAAKVFLQAAENANESLNIDLRLRAASNLLAAGVMEEGLRALRAVLDQLNIPFPETALDALPQVSTYRKKLEERGFATNLRLDARLPTGEAQYIDACWAASIGLGMVDYVRAADFHARALIKSLDAGDPYRAARSLAMQSVYVAAEGPEYSDAALDMADSALRMSQTIDHPHALGLAHYGRGVGLFLTGRWREAEETLEHAAGVFRERCQSATWERATTHTMLLSSMAVQGNFQPLIARVPDLLEWARDRRNDFFATSLRTGYPSLAWLCGDDPDTAERNYTEAMVIWNQEQYQVQHYFAVMTQVNLALYTGKYHLASEHLESAWKRIQASMVGRVHFVRSDLVSLRIRAALAALMAGAGNQSLVTKISANIARFKRSRAPWVEAQAFLFEGVLSEYQGTVERAVESYGTAIERLESIGLAPYCAVAKLRLGSLIQGELGDEWLKNGQAELKEMGIRNPMAMARIYAPNPI